GQVFRQVIAFLGCPLRLDRRRAIVERGIELIVLPADEPVKALETATWVGPVVVGTNRGRLEDRYLVALAELGSRIAVQPQGLGQRGAGVGAQRVVAGGRGSDLGDAAHADGVVVAAREQRGATRRAERRGVEAGILQPFSGQPLGCRGLTRAAERARRPK